MSIIPISNFITPITPITPMDFSGKIDAVSGTTSKANSVDKTANNAGIDSDGTVIPFADILQTVVGNSVDNAAVSESDSYDAVLGELDDLHNIPIQSMMAQITLQTFVNVKNVIVDSYNELLRMSI